MTVEEPWTISYSINIGTFISTLVGFIGVIVTLWYNAYQARKQQERQWQHEQEKAEAKDANDRTALRNALTVELEEILSALQMFLEYTEENKGEGFIGFIPLNVELSTAIYRAVLPRITILSTLEISAVAGAYTGLIDRMNPSRWIDRNHSEHSPYHADLYIGSAKAVSVSIKIALSILKQHQDELPQLGTQLPN